MKVSMPDGGLKLLVEYLTDTNKLRELSRGTARGASLCRKIAQLKTDLETYGGTHA